MPEEVPPPRRKIQWEARLVNEYLTATYPDLFPMTNVQVGGYAPRLLDQDLTDQELRMLGSSRPRVDALVPVDGELHVIEGWIIPELGKVGQLTTYLRLIPNTPELGDLGKRPLRGFLVGPFDHSILRASAMEAGVAYVVFKPDWIWTAVASRSGAKNRDSSR